MEFLNNIWMVLTTPNELATELIVAPFTFIEAYIGINLFLTILNISSNTKNNVIYIVASSLVVIISNFLIPEPFNVLINYAFYFILIITLFKVTPFKALLAIVSPLAIFGLISTLISNPYLTLFGITAEQLSSTPIYNIGYSLCFYTISFIVILILKYTNFNIDLLDDIDKKNKTVIVANFILGFITLLVQACIVYYYINNLPMIITFLSFISLLAYFSISIYGLTRVMKLTLTTRKLQSAEEYNKTLHILHDSVRGFKHDFDNIVTTIGGYIRTDDMEGLKNYYIELEDDCQRVNNLYLFNPEVINNPRYI